MSTSNGLAARDDQLFNPGSWSKTYTVVGLTVGASTTWHARIVAKEGDDQSTASLLTPTVTVDSGANTVTFSLTSTQVATLLSTGARKFHGFWSVYNDTLARQLVTGSYVVDRTAGNSGTTTTPGTLTVTSTTTTLTVLSEQAAYSSKVSIFAVSDYGTLDLTGATDMTSIVQAAITAAAATGGTVVFPAGIIKCTGQLTVPADGTGAISNGAVKQRPVKLTGAGGFATGQVGTFVGGTRLRLTYAGSSYNDAKFVTYGLGHLAIEDITFEDTTANATTPFLYTTLTTLHVNRCAFIGATADTPAQDAIVLGGTTKPVSSGYGSTDAGFQGYGTTITNCYFNNVRRIVFGRSFCNQTQVAWNFADKGCGTNLAGGACIEFNGSLPATEAAVADSDYCTNNVIMGNYLEAPNYVYLVKLVKCISTGVIANGFVDPAGGGYVAGVRCEGAVSNGVNYPTTDTMLLGNYGWNGVVLSEDTMSTNQNNLIGGMQAQGNRFARGPLTLNDQTLALKTTGPVTFGKYPNLVQPDAATGTDGAVLWEIKRSAAEGSRPGASIYKLTQDGQITFVDHNGNGFVFDPGSGLFQATTAKNITWDCNGGGAIVNKGASFAYQDHFGGGERVAFTYNAAQDGGQIRLGGASGPLILNGTATPEGSRTAPIGSLYLRTDGGANTTLYRKESGTGSTGWVAASGGGGASIYGDGQDGNLTVSGTTTIATDKYYDTLTVQNGGVLKVAGARIFCKTLCQVDAGGVIHANGNDGAAGGTAGAATSQGMLGAEASGGAGGTGAGSVSPTHTNAYGGNGGAGGAGSGGAGGAASGYSSLLGNFGCQVPRWGPAVLLGHYSIDALSTVVAKGGGGGGGGGGDGTAGGGGGSGGGAFVLAAKSLVNNGTISANGGNGGSPAAGNRGGGGGGGGGYIGIVYDTKTGSGTITATAGTGGTHTGTGADGSSGSAGTVTQVVNV